MPEKDAQTQTGATNWEAEKAKYEDQLRALSAERNSYRQRAEAWSKLEQQKPELVKYDANGMPVSWNVAEDSQDNNNANNMQYANPGTHPFYGVVENPQNVDQWVQSMVQQQVKSAGYITPQQAQQIANQAYQAARGDFMIARTYDKLVSDPKYRDLGKYDSELSKRTASILQERNLGRPLDNAKAFDQWQYGSVDAMQFAADMARIALHEESQQASESQQQAEANQQHAQLSVGTTDTGSVPQQGKEIPVSDGEVDWNKMRSDTERRAQQLGVVI